MNPTTTVSAAESRALVGQLKRSRVFRDYEAAFREITGLPLALRPVEAFDLPHHCDPKQNPFCAVMAGSNHSCAACLELQRQIEESAHEEPKTLNCFAGFSDSAVPVRVGEKLVAFLQTGQILTHPPKKSEFKQAARLLGDHDRAVDLAALEATYFKTRVLTRKQYESVVRLLTIFAQHLSALSNQLMVQSASSESPAIAKARAFIAERYSEELSLPVVAQSVNMSAFYFCKSFKRATGMTFTDYLARVRVEKVKDLLLNPHKRISEAAYEVGFQSLSQFNRVFRRVAGASPSFYRERLPVAVNGARPENTFRNGVLNSGRTTLTPIKAGAA
jgi:AraC-like DNA-binding protein/ligand-binding sensor protein